MMPAHSSGASLLVGVAVGQRVGVAPRRPRRTRRSRRRRPSRCSAAPGRGSRARAGRSGRCRRCGAARRSPTRSPTAEAGGARARAASTTPTTSWPGHDARPVRRQVALGHVQVGAAHPAGRDPDPELARPGFGHAAGRRRRSGRSAIGPGRSTTQARISWSSFVIAVSARRGGRSPRRPAAGSRRRAPPMIARLAGALSEGDHHRGDVHRAADPEADRAAPDRRRTVLRPAGAVGQ